MEFKNLEEVAKYYDLGKVLSIESIKISDFSSSGNGCVSDVDKRVIRTNKGSFLHKQYNNSKCKPKQLDFLYYLTEKNFESQHLLDRCFHTINGVESLFFSYLLGEKKRLFGESDYFKLGNLLSDFHTTSLLFSNGRDTIIFGDCHPGNIIFINNMPYLIDLDNVCVGSPEYDIGLLCFYHFAMQKANFKEVDGVLKQILLGYTNHNLLSSNLSKVLKNEFLKIVAQSKQVTKNEFKSEKITDEKVKKRYRLFKKIEKYDFINI